MLLILRVKYSYFEIFIVVNRPYFVTHTIPYKVYKFSTVPLVTNIESHNAWRVHELIVGFFSRRELGPPVIKTETCRQPHLQPKRLNMAPCANVSSVDKSLWQESPEATTNLEGLEASATASKQNPEMVQSPLNRKVVELSENETLLEVQVESVKNHLQGKQKALEDLPAMNDRRGKVCCPATTGPIVRKPLVTMSTLASSRPSTQNYWSKFQHYGVNWKNLNKSMRKFKATTKYLPLPTNELSQRI